MARILIAEDNPLSLELFALALGEAGHTCDVAMDGDMALELALHRIYDLLLIDRNLPGLSGSQMLTRLRANPCAKSGHTAAIATSAHISQDVRGELLRGGFAAVLAKPVAIDHLHATVNTALEAAAINHAGQNPCQPVSENRSGNALDVPPLLDDAQALAACGDMQVTQALRTMFASELDALPNELNFGCDLANRDALSDRLHRLVASCGFCGAAALAASCALLREALDSGQAIPASAIERLLALADATRSALADAAHRNGA